MAGANFLDQLIRKVLRTSSKPNATSLTGAGLRYKLSGRNAHGLPAAKNLVANRSGRSRPNCKDRVNGSRGAILTPETPTLLRRAKGKPLLVTFGYRAALRDKPQSCRANARLRNA